MTNQHMNPWHFSILRNQLNIIFLFKYLLYLSLFLILGLIVIADLKSTELPKLFKKEGFHKAFTTYTVSLMVGIFLVLLGTLWLGLMPLNAAHVIHKKMVACLIRAPLSFYATNPVGRIINRFSQDINNLDEFLPLNLTLFCHIVSPTIASLLLASIVSTFLLPLVLVILLVFFLITKFYLSSVLDLKRLTSIAGGPLYSHFSNTMEGVRTIRVYNRQEDFTTEVYKYVFGVLYSTAAGTDRVNS